MLISCLRRSLNNTDYVRISGQRLTHDTLDLPCGYTLFRGTLTPADDHGAIRLDQKEEQVLRRNFLLRFRSALRQHHLQADLFVENRRHEEENQQKEGDVRH